MARLRQALRRAARRPSVVAAVPVRQRAAGGLEFLLVRTRSGERWTFPKGRVEPGEKPAAAAAREAGEEAGVKGKVVAGDPLGVYCYESGGGGFDEVTAFLLAVKRDGLPAEAGRTPTWFGFEAARSHLALGRDGGYGEAMEEILRAAERAAGADVPGGDAVT